mmetsp:Transcript_21520/g.44949  ORF Transcript_21520/g.44949 Transcript_21520/m.44949 type:complete len:237 (+) Transcript_21520:1063-1773(+)
MGIGYDKVGQDEDQGLLLVHIVQEMHRHVRAMELRIDQGVVGDEHHGGHDQRGGHQTPLDLLDSFPEGLRPSKDGPAKAHGQNHRAARQQNHEAFGGMLRQKARILVLNFPCFGVLHVHDIHDSHKRHQQDLTMQTQAELPREAQVEPHLELLLGELGFLHWVMTFEVHLLREQKGQALRPLAVGEADGLVDLRLHHHLLGFVRAGLLGRCTALGEVRLIVVERTPSHPLYPSSSQ